MRWLLVSAGSLLLTAACTFSSVYSPLSSPAAVDDSVEYTVYTPCGLDAMPFDIDGSMWMPMTIDREDREGTPDGFAPDQDVGTLTLLSEDSAEYRTSKGRVIPLTRLQGDFEAEDC